MTPAEIVADLGVIQDELSYGGGSQELKDGIDAVRAHLRSHTQPITPEGLEARGFNWRSSTVLQRRLATPGTRLEYWEGFREPFRLSRWSSDLVLTLPGVRTLGDVDDLIRMLEGGE